ncbi:MAG TPA: hypothetical protein PKI14_11350 [Fervidobacterium sp.]|nr:hypothetical protein [Fervidobacterium sp.]
MRSSNAKGYRYISKQRGSIEANWRSAHGDRLVVYNQKQIFVYDEILVIEKYARNDRIS